MARASKKILREVFGGIRVGKQDWRRITNIEVLDKYRVIFRRLYMALDMYSNVEHNEPDN